MMPISLIAVAPDGREIHFHLPGTGMGLISRNSCLASSSNPFHMSFMRGSVQHFHLQANTLMPQSFMPLNILNFLDNGLVIAQD